MRNYLDARPPYALTVHKSQGSTYRDGVWLDLGDMGRATRATELKRLVYVAITCTGSKVFVKSITLNISRFPKGWVL